MTTTRVLAGLVSNGNILADGTITPEEVGIINISGVTYPGDDQAANPAGGQTITINGAGFLSTPTVYVGGVIAPSVSFISSTQITFTSPAKTAGTYDIYVVNPSGSTAIRVYGISYSGTPTWTTPAGELGPVDANFTIQLVAAGDAPVTYALTSGSTLPSGVTLSSAGLITGSALTVEQTFNFSVDAIDGQAQETPRSFAVTVSLADPYFRYVSLLLSGDPLVTPFDADASTNNFDLTVNGDARSDNFTPYRGDGYYGNYFNGSNAYFSAPAAAGALGTTDFTIEMWYRSSGGHGTYARAVSKGIVGTAPEGAWGLGVYRGANEFYWSSYYNSAFNDISTGINLNDGVWHHIAATRVGTSLRLYSDGVLRATGTIPGSFNFGASADPLMVAYQNRDNNYVNGTISNMRILIGTALYTGSTYTVPTTPLTTITNTVLLTCQSCRFVDKSTNAYALTTSGSPTVSASQPFTLPSNIATYGSGSFDGSGDYLSVPSNTAFQMGSGNFTVECWAYMNGAAQQFFFGQWNTPNRSWVFLLKNSGTTLSFTYSTTGSNELQVDGTIAAQAGRWAHFAAVRNGNTLTTYMNGVVVATGSVTGVTLYSATQAIEIGRNPEATSTWNFSGYTTDIRVVKGTAVYTAAFTPPTAPLTAISGTSLLTTQYNGAVNNSVFRDSSQNNFPVTRNGNTTQGTFSPYGANWSSYFDGNGDYLSFPNNTAFTFGTGDFTVECWVFRTGTGAGTNFYESIIGGNESSPNYWNFYVNSSNNTIVWYGNDNTLRSTSNTITNNLWNHVAVARSGTTLKIFINGVEGYSATVTTNYSLGSAGGRIGYDGPSTSTGNRYFNGYISNARVVKGTAVYTSAFTPPTAPLTAITNTSLLTCADNRFIDDSTNNFTVTRTGDVSVQRFSPFGPSAIYATSIIGGSGYFDGTGDYLSLSDNAALQWSTGDFCVEAWIYPSSVSGSKSIVCKGTNNTGTFDLGLYGAKIELYTTALVFSSSASLSANTWTHVAVTRSGTTLRCFINGALDTTVTSSYNFNNAGTFYVGVYGSASVNYFNGYMSDVRCVKGSAVYTSAFTPPTAPLTSITNTSLLTNYTNAGILDNAMMSDLETVGNAQISTSVKKYGTGSVYLDGTNSILTTYKKLPLGQGTGDFTIEFWFRPVTIKLQTIFSMLTTVSSVNPHIFMDASGFVNYYTANSTRISGSVALSSNTWYFITLCRASGTTRLFINGTQSGTSYSDSNSYVTPAYVNMGQYMSSDGVFYTSEWCHGYFDDVRLSNYARYTANFTPPTAPFKGK